MLHLLYILAFTAIAFLAVGNLIRNLVTLSRDSQRTRSRKQWSANERSKSAPHPELLDDTGRVSNEPLLVMRSMSVEDAREQLDALYDSSPSGNRENREDA